MTMKKLTAAVFAGLSLTLAAGAAMAQTPAPTADAQAKSQWAAQHPRRAEVNARLAHQDARIRTERREGELTKAQAHRLHREDARIRREERMMARNNHGHITKAEQHSLNQQENAVSAKIGK